MNLDASVLSPEQTAKYELLRLKLRALYRRDQFEIHEKILVWHDQLKLKYPAARSYMLFHLISGSTFDGFSGHFDFSSEDSVELFIEREYAAAFPASGGLQGTVPGIPSQAPELLS